MSRARTRKVAARASLFETFRWRSASVILCYVTCFANTILDPTLYSMYLCYDILELLVVGPPSHLVACFVVCWIARPTVILITLPPLSNGATF